MIPQIEHAWESSAGEPRLIPRLPSSIGALCPQQEIDSSSRLRARSFSRIDETHDGPCGLGSRAGSSGLVIDRIIVRAAGLSPATVGILDSLEPGCALPIRLGIHVFADSSRASQHLPGAVNVVGTPPPEPRAIRILFFAQEGKRLLDPRV